MTDIDHFAPAASPALSQGTTIEQSRVIAEVQAMIVVAQQVPRDMTRVLGRMRESCRQPALAEKAFYRYPRGGKPVTGPTIHLARELARVYGNITYGITELARDDTAGRSEMLAFAWDAELNVRAAQIFISPHFRDRTKDDGTPETVQLTALRDIYESNTNQGARRLRMQLYAVLPPWFVTEAQSVCKATLEDGGGQSLAQRAAQAIEMFDQLGVSIEQLADKVGRLPGTWSGFDIAQLGITYRSIRDREVTVEDEFPSRRVTVEDITGAVVGADQGGTPQPKRDFTAAEQTAWLIDLDRAHAEGDLQGVDELADTATAHGRPDLAEQAAAVLAEMEAGNQE